MSPRDFFRIATEVKGLCFLGLHRWAYSGPDEYLNRVCGRCGKYQERWQVTHLDYHAEFDRWVTK